VQAMMSRNFLHNQVSGLSSLSPYHPLHPTSAQGIPLSLFGVPPNVMAPMMHLGGMGAGVGHNIIQSMSGGGVDRTQFVSSPDYPVQYGSSTEPCILSQKLQSRFWLINIQIEKETTSVF